MDDEEGFSCHVELAVLQALVLADGERAAILTGVRRGAETEPHPRLLRRHTLRAAICEPAGEKGQQSAWERAFPARGRARSALPGSRVGPRSPTSCRGLRRLRAPRRRAAGHGAAEQEEESPHGSGGGRTERRSRARMNGWTHARTDARRRRRRFNSGTMGRGQPAAPIGHASRDVTHGMNGRPRPAWEGGSPGVPSADTPRDTADMWRVGGNHRVSPALTPRGTTQGTCGGLVAITGCPQR